MKKILLVGNGESFLKNNISDVIDSFDIVCRYNFGGSKTSLDRGKDFMGTKKDIWFNFDFSNFVKDGKITTNKHNIEYIHSYDKVYIPGVDWQVDPLLALGNSFEQHVKVTPKIFEDIQNKSFDDVVNLNEVYDTEIKNIWLFPLNYSEETRIDFPKLPQYNIPTTGLKSIHFLLKKYPKLYLCGFDGGKTKHWDKNYKFQNKENRHNGKLEQSFLKQLEKQDKIEFID